MFKARISQAEAEEIAMKAETSTEQKREWFLTADSSNDNEVNQKAKARMLETSGPFISSRLERLKRINQ